MSITRKAEVRSLSHTELEVVAATHHPGIRGLGLEELQRHRRLIRAFRDKARDTAHQQRREMRGKGDVRGMSPARDNAGTVQKGQILSGALKRVNREIRRRNDTQHVVAAGERREREQAGAR